jgi:type IV pilus assembly protein PilE
VEATTVRLKEFSGFTLIEILIVVALLGLLLSLALPSYQRYLERGHRVEAIRMLTGAAACQERHRALTGAYDTTRCNRFADNHHYRLSIKPKANPSSMAFTLIAEPVMHRESDICGSLSLDQSGARTISGAQENLWKCWSGR